MIEKLKINAIYSDFLNSVRLTEEQIKILDMIIIVMGVIQKVMLPMF